MIGLIDGDFIPYTVCHCKKLENGTIEEKTLSDIKDSTDYFIKSMLRLTSCDEYIIALTVGKCFRYDIYSDYKANRKYLEKPKFYDEIKEYLITKWKAIYHKELEADDIINIYKKTYKDSIIISPDKDMLMLEGFSYNPTKQYFNNIDKETADCYFFKSMLMGDSADNIPGLPGVGKVGALKLLEEINSVEGLHKTVKNAYIQTLGDNAKEYFTEQASLLWMTQQRGQTFFDWMKEYNGASKRTQDEM